MYYLKKKKVMPSGTNLASAKEKESLYVDLEVHTCMITKCL